MMTDLKLVHRTVPAEVFVLDHTVIDGRLVADVGVPGMHPRAMDDTGALSTLVLLEVFRQGAFLAAHEILHIPVGWHFVTQVFSLTWTTPPPRFCRTGVLWADLTVTVDATTRKGLPHLVTWNFEFRYNNDTAAVGTFSGWVLAPEKYAAIRRHAAPPAPPSHTELLTPAEEGWIIGWNPEDRFLFNRTADHIVSMALADAVLAAIPLDYPHHGRPRTFEMTFTQFAEPTPDIHLTHTHSAIPTTYTLHQSDTPIATAHVQ